MDPIKVLIVDDEPRICRGVERLVASLGEEWEVAAALGDGRQALAFLDSCGGAVDLLITDIRMPEVDGLTLIQQALKKYEFSAIVLTGYDDFEYVQAALRGGAADYMLKPIDREQFAVRLKEIEAKIQESRLERYRRIDSAKQEALLRRTRQTQALAYITAADSDITRLGYWVDQFPEGWFLLMHISMDAMPVKARAFTDKDWQAYFYALENIMTEVAENSQRKLGGTSWFWKGQPSGFWILLALPADAAHAKRRLQAEETGEQICRAVRSFTPFTVSVGYGDWTRDLYLLPMIKRQCLAAVQHRLLSGGGQVFRVEGTAGDRDERDAGGDGGLAALLQAIKRSIEQADPDRTESECRRLFARIESFSSPLRIREAAANLMLLVHSTLLESGEENSAAESVENALQAVQEAVNLQELRRTAVAEARRAAAALAEARNRQNVKPVEAAKAWIQENLGGSLTIKKIADAVFMNPTYFCEYFKLQTGETVLDYVTRMRMEQAGRLLLDPGRKLQEVSRSVGYHDAKYFSRLFKQHFGELPSHYRDSRQSAPAPAPAPGKKS